MIFVQECAKEKEIKQIKFPGFCDVGMDMKSDRSRATISSFGIKRDSEVLAWFPVVVRSLANHGDNDLRSQTRFAVAIYRNCFDVDNHRTTFLKLIVAIIGKINRSSPAYKRKRNSVVQSTPERKYKRNNIKMAERPFNRWDKVEVKLSEGEFAGGIYGGVIIRVWSQRYVVRLTTLTDGETGRPLVVHVGFATLQPVPPKVLVEFKQFDLVEVWYRRGWWPTAIARMTAHNQFHVILADGTRLFKDESELRIH
ncbi:hypothetical protein L2E82_44982 [Cichorium intybus]|uniref:Uncharacterized protein n=1 Tax=Cichorium intybus TaxID=13427 RepID=A0ACB8ZRM1_CICIN|nr:hypothetical protein L2E82_44982 [Cichorium intybus]